MFEQGELAQLSHSAFNHVASAITDGSEQEIEVKYPVGYHPTKQPILGTLKYSKSDLINRYSYLAHTQLPIHGIFHLATLVESMFGDVIRVILMEYPGKIGSRRQVRCEEVLKAKSIEELHLHISNSILNELSYKSPTEFGKEAADIVSVNLLECSAYHQYIEMKATRDVFVHNDGVANEIYVRKAGSHARVRSGVALPINQVYFLECYESCLQLLEWFEQQLHSVWHSSEFVQRAKDRAKKAT